MKEELEQILNGPDYFTCKALRIKMKKVQCSYMFSEEGFSLVAGKTGNWKNQFCRKCDQGAEIRKELGHMEEIVTENNEKFERRVRHSDSGHRMCNVPSCSNFHMARGLCRNHYTLWRSGMDMSQYGLGKFTNSRPMAKKSKISSVKKNLSIVPRREENEEDQEEKQKVREKKIPSISKSSGKKIVIDFNLYEDEIFTGLSDIASMTFRTIEQQVVFYVVSSLERDLERIEYNEHIKKIREYERRKELSKINLGENKNERNDFHRGEEGSSDVHGQGEDSEVPGEMGQEENI